MPRFDHHRDTPLQLIADHAEVGMALKEEIAAARARWRVLTLYQKFEELVILILTGLIAIVVVFAVWNLALKIAASLLAATFDPTDHAVFQAVFGMILTIIIALEFKRSILVVAERRYSVVQARTIVLIALLALVRKILILELNTTGAEQLLGLGATILALGAVYWLVAEQERRDTEAARSLEAATDGNDRPESAA